MFWSPLKVSVTVAMNFRIFVFLVTVIQASDEWKLVFKAVTGGNGMIYDLYTGNATANINNEQAQSISQPTDEHFKSDIINNWSEASIVEVRLGIYKNGSEVAFFLFDGVGSNKTDWFSKERLIDSSYSDLKNASSTTPVNYFIIDGLQGLYNIWRSFYINSDWGGCPSDSGWLMVVDTNSLNGCPWELAYFPIRPVILFSPLSTRCNYALVPDDILADSMAIFVKFGDNNLTCSSMCSTPIQLDAKSYCYKPCASDVDTDKWTTNIETSVVTGTQTNSKTTTISISTTESSTTESTTTTGSTTNIEMSSIDINTVTVSKGMSSAEINQKIIALRETLKVHKKNTTSYKRSLSSIYENRTSAKAMGYFGVCVICSVFGLFISFDFGRFTVLRKMFKEKE